MSVLSKQKTEISTAVDSLRNNPILRPGALGLDDLLKDIDVKPAEAPDIGLLNARCHPLSEDIFQEKKRKAWKQVDAAEARCDFSTGRSGIINRNTNFSVLALWRKSVYGRTLSDIKSDDQMINFFAVNMKLFISKFLGAFLDKGNFAIVTTPKRRHKERNFASLVSAQLASMFNINFYEDLAIAKSRQRVGAVFSLAGDPPTEQNLIVFDDFVTTGSTMIAMYNLLYPLGYNLSFFCGIHNKS